MKSKKRTGQRGRKEQQSGALTTADLIVLSLLAERSMHGYELLGEYERQEVADWASVSKAQVYYAIQKMAKLGLIVERGEPEEEGVRDRTVYAPTAKGLAELRLALGNEDWARTRVAQPFATWLGLSIHLSGEEAGRVLEARRAFLTEELARERASLEFIRGLENERARAGELIVDLVIRQMEVELDWVARTRGRRAVEKTIREAYRRQPDSAEEADDWANAEEWTD